MNFFMGISTVCFTPKTHVHMHVYKIHDRRVDDVRLFEYTQLPRAFTWT